MLVLQIMLKEDYKSTTSLKAQDSHFVTDHGLLFEQKNLLQNRKQWLGRNSSKQVKAETK